MWTKQAKQQSNINIRPYEVKLGSCLTAPERGSLVTTVTYERYRNVCTVRASFLKKKYDARALKRSTAWDDHQMSPSQKDSIRFI